ncbi:hypothetical protein [Bacillus wiedmannii]|uniref:hypothetical protein n=1 Tax=Bacillus wiedmannii TaxID=1890302 RepID=UPI0018CEBA40|nr:hypothetical protein [Bacillus wiedmannii]MBG9858113.1 hypothetical protein [Bacillus wiedmannii]
MNNLIEFDEISKEIKRYLDIINAASPHRIKHEFSSSTILASALTGNRKCLDEIHGKIGVYIFMDNERHFVYIGVGGLGKKDSLKTRVNKEHRVYGENKDQSGTLSRNIQKILGVKPHESMKVINTLSVLTITLGKIGEGDDSWKIKNLAQILERFLIYYYKPKFNIR